MFTASLLPLVLRRVVKESVFSAEPFVGPTEEEIAATEKGLRDLVLALPGTSIRCPKCAAGCTALRVLGALREWSCMRVSGSVGWQRSAVIRSDIAPVVWQLG